MSEYEEPIDIKSDFNPDAANADPVDDDTTSDVEESDHIVSSGVTFSGLDKTHPDEIQYPFLLPNEKARVIGVRAEQLVRGAPALVDTTGMTCVKKIALKELEEGRLPYVIRRGYPDGSYVDIRLSELKLTIH